MFGRKTNQTTSEPAPDKAAGKGRPTPTRKQAEAEARARAKASASGVDPRASNRKKRIAESRAAREGMARGDDRYLLPRDKGPVRRFLRDLVDSRIHIAEMLLPLLVLYMLLFFLKLQQLAVSVEFTTFAFVAVDLTWLIFKARREVRRRFPGESLRGTSNYVAMRAIQLRPTRRPKAAVKLGDSLPEHYR